MIDTLVYGALTKPNLESALKDNAGWRVYPVKALGNDGIPAQPAFPFVQYGDGGSNANTAVRGTRKSLTATYDVFVYDHPGSYQRIKTIHDLIQENLELVVGLVTPKGWRITDLVFQGYGGDGYDPVNQQASKRATYRVVFSAARQ
jgi:hypothetical protein